MKTKDKIKGIGEQISSKETNLKNLIFSYKFAFSIFYSIVLTFVLFFNYSPQIKEYTPGDIAKKDIKAPFDFKVINVEATERLKEGELKKSPYVYDYVSNSKETALERVKRLFSYLEAPKKNYKKIDEEFGITLSKEDIRVFSRKSKRERIGNIVKEIIDVLYSKDIIRDKNKLIGEGKEEAIITKGSTKSILKLSETWGERDIKTFINKISKKRGFSLKESALIEKIIFTVYSPMYLINESKTRVLRESTAKNLTPVYNIIKKGRIIIRNGDEVDEKTCDILKKLRTLQEHKRKPFSLIGISFLFILLILFLSSFILAFFERRYLSEKKIIHIAFTNLVFFVLLYRSILMLIDVLERSGASTLLFTQKIVHFFVPFQAGGIILAFLVGIEVAVVFILLFVALVGIFLVKNYYLLFFIFITSFIPILKIKVSRESKRSMPIKLSLYYILPAAIIVVLFGKIIAPSVMDFNLFSVSIALLSDTILVAIFVTAFLPFEESIFKVVSDLKLLELSNLDLPIFREMALKAPGTYHHSLMVASLAEQAAKDVGINPTLVRCQALYHDIGKILRPNYFIENIPSNEENIHNKLSPTTSVVYIKNHISDGVTLAKKYGLPDMIIDGIKQHHGTSLISFFYNKELEKKKKENSEKEELENEEAKIDKEFFRYPGPKPQTKETAILMLADSVEAAAKSLTEINEETFSNLIKKIFSKIIEDDQLNESDLSLKDIKIISESFLKALKNIYHGRISYPGFNFNEGKKEKNDNSK